MMHFRGRGPLDKTKQEKSGREDETTLGSIPTEITGEKEECPGFSRGRRGPVFHVRLRERRGNVRGRRCSPRRRSGRGWVERRRKRRSWPRWRRWRLRWVHFSGRGPRLPRRSARRPLVGVGA